MLKLMMSQLIRVHIWFWRKIIENCQFAADELGEKTQLK